jgi:hypothetical protein
MLISALRCARSFFMYEFDVERPSLWGARDMQVLSGSQMYKEGSHYAAHRFFSLKNQDILELPYGWNGEYF